VMNSQREVIYGKRRNALYGDRISVDIANMMYDVCESIVEQYYANTDYEEFNFEIIRLLSINNPIDEQEYIKLSNKEMIERLYEATRKAYVRKTESIRSKALPIIQSVYERQSKTYENILVPITDGMRTYNIITNLEKNYTSGCEELIRSYEKSLTLATIDENWKEHLRELDDLKQSVQNATYEQKDPLLIYKFESFELFKTMIDKINKEVVNILMKGQLPVRDPDEVRRGEAPRHTDMSRLQASKSDYRTNYGGGEGQQRQQPQKIQPVRVDKKVGRNDPCPCGSGKKYKNCHGKVGAETVN